MPRYRIVPEESRVFIDARSNVHPIHTSTEGLEGFVDLDFGGDGVVDLSASKPSGKLSLPVSRLSSGNGMEDREMQKRVDARKFPTIEGVLGEIASTGRKNTYLVSGDVTFRGVSRPHSDEMTISPVDESTVELTGKSTFDIRDFGMEPPRVLLLKVQPDVDVRVDITAVKE
ncbi:MAG: YceI family protein [Acidimicrobiales bacterium]